MSPNMKIPISKNWFAAEELAAVQQPLLDGWVVQGKQVKAFEAAFSKYVRAEHALACSSGTAALQIAVAALGIKPGDEVVVPGFTWVATANVVELLGGKAVFADIDLDTFNMNAKSLEAALTAKTVGVIPVHLFGLCAEMQALDRIARSSGLWVIEDAACGLGAQYYDRHAGTLGDVGCFSFHPRKSITTGEGGMLTMATADLARRCDGLRNHGAVPPSGREMGNIGHASLLPEYSIAGFNYRLTDIQGALGAAQLGRLDWLLAERRRCAVHYSQTLSEISWLRLPKPAAHQTHAWQSYVTLFAPEESSMKNVDRLHRQRNRLMQYLEDKGVSTRQGTHAPAHLAYYAEKYGIRPDDFPNSYLADRLSLALPLYPGMTESELNYVSECLSQFAL